MSRLLLLSNSTTPGEPYLHWPRPLIAGFLGLVRSVLFVPFAGVRTPWGEYTAGVRAAFNEIGCAVESIHDAPDPVRAVEDAGAIVVGGGNTFHLLDCLYRYDLLDPIRARVRDGLPYIGWSAGSNVACPTICTTNDMPVVEPPSFAALGLVPFQINAHFTDAVVPNHGGETRRQRLEEFLVLNPDRAVVGLREESGLQVEGSALTLVGRSTATVFVEGRAARDLEPGPVDDDALRLPDSSAAENG